MDVSAIARERMRAQRLWDSDVKGPQRTLEGLVAVQSQEFAFALWSLAQRSGFPPRSEVRRAFDDGRLLRTHILRPTWHFVAPRDLHWLMRLSGPRVAGTTKRRCEELGLDARTLKRTNDVIARAVAEGPLTRRALAAILDRRGLSPDGQRMPYILMRAELDMVICSGPLEGKQQTYAAFASRVPSPKEISRDEALGRLAKRYFTSRGPATLRDFNWWSGLPMADVRRAADIAHRSLASRDIGGRTYFSSIEQPPMTRKSHVDLVQVYDEAIIAYGESRDVLHTGTVSFATPSNIGGFAHVILHEGRLLGHWRTRATNAGVDVETRLAEQVDARTMRSLEKAMDRYRRFAMT